MVRSVCRRRRSAEVRIRAAAQDAFDRFQRVGIRAPIAALVPVLPDTVNYLTSEVIRGVDTNSQIGTASAARLDPVKKLPVLLAIAFGTATAVAGNATLDAAIGGVAGAATVDGALGAAVGTALNTQDGPRHGSSRRESGHAHPAPRDSHFHSYFRPPGQASKGRC